MRMNTYGLHDNSLTPLANMLYIRLKFIVVPRAWLRRAVERYGLKIKLHIWAVVVPLCVCALAWPATAPAQGVFPWLGTSSWWDWSDFRGSVGYRVLVPTVSGHVEVGGDTISFSDFGITSDTELFRSLHVLFYVDRLGILAEIEEDHKFPGAVVGSNWNPPNSLGGDPQRLSELDVSTSKLGLDLDIVRYPFVRGGINFTYHLGRVEFFDRRKIDYREWSKYEGDNAMTLGVHARALPLRIRDVPVTVAARVRFPIPFLNSKNETEITEWEVCGGLRPAVWETSLLGHATFSFGIEGGYRQTFLHMCVEPVFGPEREVTVDARWAGPFIQATLVY